MAVVGKEPVLVLQDHYLAELAALARKIHCAIRSGEHLRSERRRIVDAAMRAPQPEDRVKPCERVIRRDARELHRRLAKEFLHAAPGLGVVPAALAIVEVVRLQSAIVNHQVDREDPARLVDLPIAKVHFVGERAAVPAMQLAQKIHVAGKDLDQLQHDCFGQADRVGRGKE